ncbi:MAG TPA: plasmid mobilization relaxosome protein MobC [Actinomycetaceae bacterium]|nr:plasmid mobilization relaxosome protein MobC [Actinomycetaceae bacterium]
MAEDSFAVASRGKRRANADEPRSKRVVLKLTDGEFAYLEALARAQYVSKQAVLMRAVLTGGTEAAARYEQLLEALARTRFQLATVANNVNQLAHQANSFALGSSEPVQAEDVHEVLHEVRAVMERVEGVAGQIGARDDR